MNKYGVKCEIYPVQRKTGYMYYVKADGYTYESPMRHTRLKLEKEAKQNEPTNPEEAPKEEIGGLDAL